MLFFLTFTGTNQQLTATGRTLRVGKNAPPGTNLQKSVRFGDTGRFHKAGKVAHRRNTTSATEEMAFFLLPVEALLRVSSHARETQAKKKGGFFFI